ncbi:DUF3800 domain-containing protein [Sphingomonas sp. TDK1]|uniref:DUF3800 domain-containing protein n=1 Tax=Sphingomonas sp. TDK1 TaxID=453247 RepID=UPI0007D92DD5|nr:DUF3800 domain-containing protein [Sphingomonas sp. TDK1]OAN65984.1 hypothetical protein A7X12_14745 [Sphingomonas sp. TDK1]
MLTIYLDDSDADTGAVLTIAGYLAEQEAWKRFESEAEAICQQFGVNVIHCTEFEKNKGCFAGWSVPKRTGFLLAIRDAMLGNVICGISRSMPKDYYKARKAQLRLNPQIGAYGFSFGTIVHTLCHGNEVGLMERVAAEGVAYKVETGHKNNPELASYIQGEIECGNIHESTTIEFVEKTSCRAIQISDLYAFYSRRSANKWYKSKGRLTYFPDMIGLHFQPLIPHFNGIVEEPYVSATNLRTGDEFQIKGLVTEL